MRISVCMASYNGAAYIEAQVNSILALIDSQDELIIVDDNSCDDTCQRLLAIADTRLKLHRNTSRQGHVIRFSEAVARARGDIIMLADQDDIWPDNRLEPIRAAFDQPEVQVVAGNFSLIDSAGKPLGGPGRRLNPADSNRRLTNILAVLWGRRPYFGCAMAFRRRLIPTLLPVPASMESHDLWLALVGNSYPGGMYHLAETILCKRQHADNVSAGRRRRWPQLLQSRLGMLWALVILLIRRAGLFPKRRLIE